MPNNPSAKKRLRQNLARRAHNRAIKSAVRSRIRAVKDALKIGDIEKAEKELVEASRRLDKAGSKRIFHPNTAARYKSRLAQRIKKAKQAASESAS